MNFSFKVKYTIILALKNKKYMLLRIQIHKATIFDIMLFHGNNYNG